MGSAKFDIGQKQLRRRSSVYLIVLHTLFGSLYWNGAEAQQDPMYTQYMNNILSINPAYASVSTTMELNLLTRNQWVGVDGAPVTQSFSALMPLKNIYAGVGLSFISDKIGPVKQTGAYVDYSFKIRLAYRTYLSFGLKAGVNFFNTDYSILEVNDEGDPILSDDVTRKFLPNFGIGLFLYDDRFFAGLSIPKLLENQIHEVGYSSQYASKEEMHFFGIAGYVFELNRDVKFKSYTLVKLVPNSPVSLDVSAHFLFYDRLWVGANWRVGDAVGAMTQLFVTKQLKVGYAYDVTATDLNSFNKGTHEILVNFVINAGRRRFISPRYF
ncbi:PorP/SprF family type IX secretion system membrane protein [Mangrovibacterium lignilyticum]|uniref:PorP/SprF family type IX secretion system membrane protein n=1 Tax=Mangrovibacterium lignilyticum TaxID=2668052 RepID=UPI0013D213A0|nr:type IX secretion system membrane protein PorP/SprF [Mangrovibacterium lignilyticum]